jgi:hypothetical protein
MPRLLFKPFITENFRCTEVGQVFNEHTPYPLSGLTLLNFPVSAPDTVLRKFHISHCFPYEYFNVYI